ncbi:WXG100 family type VII secretion target [Mycobacterium lacus]|nr:WXG100 family type VII secretion target [Mycobacterium lacus]MCV7123620.1 WXG100 family type VII secretion target [Mycobacterium lacus]ORW01167.1 type VII secretion protein EsxB [Mycobacterium lacus]
MAEMKTDAATLATEARNFERISGDLKNQIAKVESTASSLASQWRGQAGTAAQAALLRFHEAATKQIQELNDISTNIHAAGGQYAAADDQQHQALAAQMQF